MSQDQLVTLYCSETNEYITTRFTKKKFTNKNFKLSLRKYSKKLRKYVDFVLTKKLFKKK